MIILDRDWVLNQIVVHSEQGTIDSPMNVGEVILIPGAADAVAILTAELGCTLAIATNQPAASKGKTTRAHLEAVHAEVLAQVGGAGKSSIASSHLCFHRAEDRCQCRKPETGLLEEALKLHGVAEKDRSKVWMVGDGVTDVEAGARLGLKTAFLGPRKLDAITIFAEKRLEPGFWGQNLIEFARFLKINRER